MPKVANDTVLKRFLIFVALAAVAAILIAMAFKALLLPVLIALFFAYLLQPVVRFLKVRANLAHSFAVIVAMAVLTLFCLAGIAGLIPIMKMEIEAIAAMVPQVKLIFFQQFLPWIRLHMERVGFNTAELTINSLNLSSHLGSASEALNQVFSRTSSVFGSIVTALLVPVFLFFFLHEYDSLKKFLQSLVPHDLRGLVLRFVGQVDDTLKAVLKRQLAVAAILGVLYSFGFWVIGLKYSLAVGVIAGVFRLIPYADIAIALILGGLIIITDPATFNWSIVVGLGVVIAAVQVVDGTYITPRVIGERVGLHPAIVIASVIAFADWLGFIGVLIAIPVAAIFKIICVAALNTYKNSKFFRAN